MKVLMAISNKEMSDLIVKQYQKDYKEIITFKNVYYFNAILKELQRDKTYDRVLISEDLEQYVNTDYEQMDNFIFGRLDSISDEAVNIRGEDIPIVLICEDRRSKSEPILIKLFGIGIYNAIIGNDRSIKEICKLIKRPRSKKEAKIYYKIDTEEVLYEKDDENDVSELEIQNILAHYKRLGNDEQKYIESFDSIASQYNDMQLKVISKCLPLKVRAVLEEKSPKYQQVNAYTTKISDMVRIKKKQEQAGTSEILLKNSKNAVLDQPVIVPSEIGAEKQRKIVTGPVTRQEPLQKISQEQQIQPIKEEIEIEEMPIQEIEEQPVKRGRGRPRKIVTEPIEQKPKRGRGRPRKNKEQEEIKQEESIESILPGIETQANQPITYSEENEDAILPGFEEDDETFLPGIETQQENELPEFENEEDNTLPNINIAQQEEILPTFEQQEETNYEEVLKNLRQENIQNEQYNEILTQQETIQYPELDMNSLISRNQKLVAFVGTSKNGTSFLINNVAEILSMNDIDTAILDLTKNRNAYYIYTKNEEQLRVRANQCISNLIEGRAEGIQQHKNLTIYTSAFEIDEIQNVEPIIETLLQKHKIVLMDCDFETPMRYFKYAQEIYLVQSMDILTIQPLTAFIRKLSDKGMFEESKARVIINKYIKTKEINEDLLVGGISIYNDAGMTVRKELFNRRTVKRITVPFEVKTYLKYLDGLVICDVSLKGYSKELLQSMKNLANMIYQGDEQKTKYVPPSAKNRNTFSPSMNDTLNQMKRNY